MFTFSHLNTPISSQRYIPNMFKKRTVCILGPVPAFGWAPVMTTIRTYYVYLWWRGDTIEERNKELNKVWELVKLSHHRTSIWRIWTGSFSYECEHWRGAWRNTVIRPYCIMVLTDHSLGPAIGFLQAKLADGEITQLNCFCELYLYITMSFTTFWRPILKAFDTAFLLKICYL